MSQDSPIQINFKTKRDGMLINLRAANGEELDTLIDAITLRLASLIDLERTSEHMAVSSVATIQKAFPGAEVVEVSTVPDWNHPAPVAQTPPPVPTGYTPPAPAGQKLCEHGEAMKLVPAGVSKAGKPYKAFYSCARPMDQRCNAR
jgi:hypothetical protein